MYRYNFLDVYGSKLISMAGARLTEKKFLTKYYGALCELISNWYENLLACFVYTRECHHCQ